MFCISFIISPCINSCILVKSAIIAHYNTGRMFVQPVRVLWLTRILKFHGCVRRSYCLLVECPNRPSYLPTFKLKYVLTKI